MIGESGTGKSTLTNALRNLYPNDPLAADTNIKECTREPTPYPFPNNEKIILWDLPGYNTPNYPIDSYFENISKYLSELEKPIVLDCYIICSANRFTENDLKIAKKISEVSRNYFFVRTKFDLDITGERKRIGRTLNANDMSELSKNIKEEIRLNLAGNKLPGRNLYTISADMEKYIDNDKEVIVNNTHKYDFPDLQNNILNCFNNEKKNALVLSLIPLGEEGFKLKYDVLRKRIPYLTAISGIIGLFPIPGTSLVCDILLLCNEIIFISLRRNISKRCVHYLMLNIMKCIRV